MSDGDRLRTVQCPFPPQFEDEVYIGNEPSTTVSQPVQIMREGAIYQMEVPPVVEAWIAFLNRYDRSKLGR